MLFNIQRFSTHDGAGVRTVLFLKGCPLRCPWCENPESQKREAELFYDPGSCIGCLDCVRAAAPGEVAVEAGRPRFNRTRIADAARFRGVCPSGALTVVGEERSVDAIVDELLRDLPFYGEEGGVTLSGGEPFAQGALVAELARAAKRAGLGVAVETSLHAPWSQIAPALPWIDTFLVDLKHADAETFHAATGGTLRIVLANLERLDRAGAHLVARVPVIPGFNADAANLRAIIRLAASYPAIRELHLLPYHALGKGKCALLGRSWEPERWLEGRARAHAGSRTGSGGVPPAEPGAPLTPQQAAGAGADLAAGAEAVSRGLLDEAIECAREYGITASVGG